MNRRWLAHSLLALATIACVTLVVWPPERYGFYPACPFRQYLHVLCPGCGATHALAALLRGHWREAWQWNALFVAMLPLGLPFALVSYWRAVRPGEFRWPAPAKAAYCLLAAAIAFAVVRNLAAFSNLF